MVVNFQGLDKYGSKNTDSQTNVHANILGKYKQTRTDDK